MAKKVSHEEFRFDFIINGDDAQKELHELGQETNKLTRENRILAREKAKLVAAGQKESAEYKKLDAAMKANNATLREKETRMDQLRKTIGVTNLSFKQLRAEQKRLSNQLNARNDFGSAQYKALEERLKSVSARMSELRGKTRASQSSLSRWANGFNKYQTLALSFVAVLTGVVLQMQQIVDFNGKMSESMSDVQKTTGMTKQEVQDLSKEFGILHTRTSRINLLAIAEQGGRIGIAKKDIGEFVAIMDKAVVALGDEFPGGAQETAKSLGTLKSLFKETRDQGVDQAYNAIGSAINELGANGLASAPNLANFTKRVGAMPDALRPAIAEALGLGAAFEESGLEAEQSARAYSIFMTAASKDVDKFARVMGISVDQVKTMINTDPTSFFLEFSQGLQGMDATDTAKTLDYLGLSADGVKKIVGSAASNTQLFRDKMLLANDAMQSGTSLIDEYNIKNNNLQATIEKIGKSIRGAFVTGPLTGFLNVVINGFAKLLGIVNDVDEAFARESQSLSDSAHESRRLASESQNLLDRYEDLVKDGVNPTEEAKRELDLITLQLKDRLGESVVAINEETGALDLNTEAVRKQIKMKRLSADDEAATLASRLVGVQERKKELQKEQDLANYQFDLRNEFFQKQNKEDLELFKNSNALSAAEEQKIIETLEGYKELSAARRSLQKVNSEINEQTEREIDLTKKLKDLNFTAQDANELLTVEAPQETGNNNTSNVPDADPDKPTGSKPKDYQRDIMNQQYELAREKVSLIKDTFEKERALEEVEHAMRVQRLKEQLIDVSTLTGKSKEDALQVNARINERIQLQDEIHQNKLGEITALGMQEKLDNEMEFHQAALQELTTAQNLEIAAFSGTEKEKEALLRKHQQDQLDLKESHAREMKAMLIEVMSSQDFEGIDLDLLSEEQREQFSARIDDLIAKIAALQAAKSNLKNGGGDEEQVAVDPFGDNQGAGVDLFGFSAGDWEILFLNLDDTTVRLRGVGMAIGALAGLYAEFSQTLSAQENRDFELFSRNQERRSQALDARLENGFISERQHAKATRALEDETAQKQAQLEYEQAKRQKIVATGQVISNTAIAASKILAQWSMPGAIPWLAALGVQTGLQLANIAKTPLPAQGFEEGLYPMMRAQDKKIFDVSFGGGASSQLVTKPTHLKTSNGSDILVGEKSSSTRPELIIDSEAYSRFDPSFKQVLLRQIRTAKGYEQGMYSSDVTGQVSYDDRASNNTAASDMLSQNLALNNRLLQQLLDKGVNAYMDRDMRTTQIIKEDLERYDKFSSKNKRA
jgi:TP901 family phage tail tape measure protein